MAHHWWKATKTKETNLTFYYSFKNLKKKKVRLSIPKYKMFASDDTRVVTAQEMAQLATDVKALLNKTFG